MKIPVSLDDEKPRLPGKIVTFYSYKGGTGRSMALANVAWILAASGRRVLAIDWDFEAPGLHRYFRPFLTDPELSDTPGLIDLFVHFVEAASLQARANANASGADTAWFHERADSFRYSVTLDAEFENGGVLDFLGAGKQGPSYGARVNSFQWTDFYEKLGGGTFLEAMKAQMREQYEYVLIDSRTGLSDTSGICTVQMPDELVVCFTLNRQSILGAAATAASADSQRRLPGGEKGLRIWPVPMRVDFHEKDRLEAARLMARKHFAPFLWHVPAGRRTEYWGRTEVLYFPYYAYDEVLATLADAPGQTASLLDSMERLTARLANDTVATMPRLAAGVRDKLLARYLPQVPRSLTPRFFISYATADRTTAVVDQIATALDHEFGPNAAFWSNRIPLGSDWNETLRTALDQAEVVVAVVGPQWQDHAHGSRQEVKTALELGKRVIPVLVEGTTAAALPPELANRRAAALRPRTLKADVRRFVKDLAETLPPGAGASTTLDLDDPHHGRFGGKSERAGRRLRASVSEGVNGWYNVGLSVESTDALPLEGEVEFHLHPTFRPPIVRVPARNDIAVLKLSAWGAFTVGVVADNGTRLELNLSELADAPPVFRER